MGKSNNLFNGERVDPLSGTYHPGNGYRSYHPTLKRFSRPDGWSPFVAGLNPYVYCLNDPVNRADPSGHMSWRGWAGVVGGIAGLILAPFSGGGSLSVSVALITAGVTSSVLSLASSLVEDKQPALANTLNWLSLGICVTDIAFSAARTGLGIITSSRRAFRAFTARLVRKNGAIGIPMSGEFRNARFLGINHSDTGDITWSMTYEDSVPSGSRLNVLTGRSWDNAVPQASITERVSDGWHTFNYKPGELKRQFLSHLPEQHSVYRMIFPDSGNSAENISFIGMLRGCLTNKTIPVTGFIGMPRGQGVVADVISNQYSIASMLNARFNVIAEPDAVQGVLTELSARYAETEGAIRFEGQVVVSSAKHLGKQYQGIEGWQ